MPESATAPEISPQFLEYESAPSFQFLPSETTEHINYPNFLNDKQIETHAHLVRSLRHFAETSRQAERIYHQIASCCLDWHVYWHTKEQFIHARPSRCKHRYCPFCAPLHQARSLSVASKATALMTGFMFWTFTLRSTDEPLAVQVKRLQKSFHEIRRLAWWKRQVKGGIYSIEFTWNRSLQQWHPHLHCILDTTYLDHRLVKSAWKELTVDSDYVHFERLFNPTHAARYMTKYITKSLDLTSLPEPQLFEVLITLKGFRLIHGFGNVYGVKTDRETWTEKHPEFIYLGKASTIRPTSDLPIPFDEFFDLLYTVLNSEYRQDLPVLTHFYSRSMDP